jgi:dihydrodipicolinate synthase/N-acetylneuraminate lyase
MAKYISIPTTVAPIAFNTDLVTGLEYTAATTFKIWCGGKSFSFTTSSNGAKGTIIAINNAIISTSGPLMTNVVLPTGVTIAAGPTNN